VIACLSAACLRVFLEPMRPIAWFQRTRNGSNRKHWGHISTIDKSPSESIFEEWLLMPNNPWLRLVNEGERTWQNRALIEIAFLVDLYY
jgi:hypothetical protein